MSKQPKSYSGFRKYLGNSAWIMADSLATNGFSLLTLAIVARMLGPEAYGAYAYVFSLAALFSVAGQMGLDGLLTRELLSRPEQALETMGTAGGLRFAGYIIGALSCLVYAFAVPGHSDTEKALFLSAVVYILLMPGPQLIENWFRSRVEARYSSIARMIGTVLGGTTKICVVLAGLGVIWVGIAQAMTMLIILAIALLLFMRRGGPDPRNWIFSPPYAKELFSESWMIFLGSILAVVYLKIDQIMLRWWSGTEAVGIYAIAARMSEVFYFVPAALVATFFPRLIKLRETSGTQFNTRLQSLFALLALLAYCMMLGIVIFAPLLLVPIFGEAYRDAVPILLVHMLAMPFIFMRYAFSRWILIEKFASFSVVSQGVGAGLNVLLNILLIPPYGMMGAAVATVISYCGASFLILPVSNRTRPVFIMMTRALFMPWSAVQHLLAMRKSKGLNNE